MANYIRTTKYTTNNVITEDNVIAKITNIDIIDADESLFKLTFKLLSGAHRGQNITDRVSCSEQNKSFGWKCPVLLNVLRLPCSNEDDEINLDELLLNKKILLKLTPYECTTNNGTNYNIQKVNYKFDYKHILDNFVETQEIPRDIPTLDDIGPKIEEPISNDPFAEQNMPIVRKI